MLRTDPVGLGVRRLRKNYGGVAALAGVDLDIAPAEIHGLLGENGAGKSTLLRIVMGVESADTGEVLVRGEPVHFRSLQDAHGHGIRMIFQHQSVVPELTVAQNFCLGEETRRFGFLQPAADAERTRHGLARLGLDIDPHAEMGSLSFAERQMVEIANALEAESRILILDEPTASLGNDESARLFEILRHVRDVFRTTIVYVSHRLEEIVDICERVTVMRDGAVVARADVTAETTPRQLAQLIVKEGGRISGARDRSDPVSRAIAVSVRDLHVPGKLESVSFDAFEGETLAVYGLIGSGRTELLQAILGVEPTVTGELHLGDRRRPFRSTAAATAAGIGFVPEDRHSDGLFMDQDIAQNALSASIGALSRFGFRRRAAGDDTVGRMMSRLAVKAPSASTPVGDLSGGNQQKVVIGRWLVAGAKLLLLDEPTVGVDVGARAQIYDVIDELRANGMTVIVASSDIDEVLTIADRVLVMRERSSVALVEGEAVNQETLMRLAFGEVPSREIA